MVEARLLALADSGSEGASPAAAADHELRDGEILRCPAPMPVVKNREISVNGRLL